MMLVTWHKVVCQTTFSWRNDQSPADNVSWLTSTPYYFWNGSIGAIPNGNDILFFDGNTGVNMTNDLINTNRHKIIFGNTNTPAARIINGVSVNTFFEVGTSFPAIQNDALNIQHTIGFPINASTNNSFNLELVANAGSLNFTNSINNNGRSILVYGNNLLTDHANRSVHLNGVLSGSGNLTISRCGVAISNAVNTFSGVTEIENGELRIESNGSITASANVYVGNSLQLTNAAALWLSGSAGGTVFTNNITVNDGNNNSRVIGGLNTSGTHTFSGNIFNNNITGGLNINATNNGGLVNCSGVITGDASVIIGGAGVVSFSGATSNTYMGSTNISGALRLGAANVIPDASGLILNGGSLSTGSGVGFSETLGSLQLTGNSNLMLGTGSHSIVFANSSSISWTASTFIVSGWTGTNNGNSPGTSGRLFIGNAATGLTALQLSKIKFNIGGIYYSSVQLSTGEIVPSGTVGYYWNGAGSWTASNTWGLKDGGPYTSSYSPGHAIFNVANSTVNFASTTVSRITANENVTVTPAGTLGTGGTNLPVYVAAGKMVDLAGQAISTAAGSGLIKNGPGTLSSANLNLYPGGFTINEGLMIAGSVNAFGSGGILNLNGGTIAANSSKDFSGKINAINIGGDFMIGSSNSPAVTNANLIFSSNISLGNSSRNITLGGTGSYLFSGVISGTGAAGITLSATSAGTLSLGGNNIYPGATNIVGGTLSCAGVNSLPATTNVTLSNNAGATLVLGNNSQTIRSLSGGGTSGGNTSMMSPAILTIDGIINAVYSGNISGGGALVKKGSGMLTLTAGTLSYSGATTISGGSLCLNPSITSASFSSSNFVLNGGTLSTNGIGSNTTISPAGTTTITLESNSVISLGLNAHAIHFSNSSLVNWNGNALVVSGWTGLAGSSGTTAKIFVGATVAGLTSLQLSKISFVGYPGFAMLLATGELVPSPGINYTWTGATDAFWNTTTNWSPNGTPGINDNIIINSPGINTLLVNTNENINNISLLGSGKMQLMSAAILSIYGAFTNTSIDLFGLYADCSSTIKFKSSAAQIIPALLYGNLDLSGGARILSSLGSIGICGNYTPSASTTTITGSKLIFNGSSIQSVANIHEYEDVIIANTNAGYVQLNGNTIIKNSLIVNNGSKLNTGVYALNLSNSTSIINGTLRSAGTIIQSGGTLTFSASGVYEHNLNGGAIPTATWLSGSPGATCVVMGTITNAPSGLTQSFYHFTWNNTGQTATISIAGSLTTVNGNLSILSTGTGGSNNGLRLTASGNTALNIGKDLNISGTTTDAKLDLSNGGNTIINLYGNLSVSQVTSTASLRLNSGTGIINFIGTSLQTISINSVSQVVNVVDFSINNPVGVLIPNGSVLPVNANATLYRALGSISTTGTGYIAYQPSSTLTYNPTGSTTLTTSNGEWPLIGGPSQVTINSSSSSAVILHAGRTLDGTKALTLSSGRIALGNNSLTISNTASTSVNIAAGYIDCTGSGNFIRAIGTNGSYIFPIGNASNYTPATFVFTSNSVNGRLLGTRVVGTAHANLLDAPMPASYINNRYWSTSVNDASGTYTYTPVFSFISTPTDVAGNINDIRLSRWNTAAGVWMNTLISNSSSTSITSTMLTESSGNLNASQWAGRSVIVPTTYTWIAGANGLWTTPGNWNPAGTPTSGDAVIFNHIGTRVISNVPTGITLTSLKTTSGITQLKTLLGGAVILDGGSNPVLTVTAGTSLVLDGDNTINILIAGSRTGLVSGNIRVEGDVGNSAAHTLEAVDPASLQFLNGSSFIAGVTGTTNYNGSPFGNTGSAGTVVFQTGSIFEQFDGANPFGLVQPASKVIFATGSLYKYSDNNPTTFALPSFSGRSFGDFEYNSTQNKTVNGGTAFSVDDFTISKGILNVNLDAVNISLKGNLFVAAGSGLYFSPATGSSVQMNNISAKTISGTGTLEIGSNCVLTIVANAVVSLEKTILCNGVINVLASGRLNVISENAITSGLTGSRTFNLQNGGTLGIGSSYGITTISGITGGNIQTTIRNFSTAANYVFNGINNQVTGNVLPLLISGSLSIANNGLVNNNVVSLSNSNTTVNALYLSAGILKMGITKQLNISASGSVNAVSGDFAAGADGGSLNFHGTGNFAGSCQPFNVSIAGGVNFGSGVVIINGSLQINKNGYAHSYPPFYGPNGALVYNTEANYFRSVEWCGNEGTAGFPNDVIIKGNTTLVAGGNLAGSSGEFVSRIFSNRKNLTIETGSALQMNGSGYNMLVPLQVGGNLEISGTLTGSETVGGDIYITGNWTRIAGGIYMHNNRAVRFQGAINSIITTSTSSEIFASLQLYKTSAAFEVSCLSPVFVETELELFGGTLNTSSVNLLTLAIPATIHSTNSGSSNSFVNGPMAKKTDASNTPLGDFEFTFPIGKSNPVQFKPAYLVPLTASGQTTYKAELIQVTTSSSTSLLFPEPFLSSLVAISNSFYWNINRSGTGSARIGFDYFPGAVSSEWVLENSLDPPPGIPVNSNIALVQNNGSSWNFTKTAGNFNDQGPRYEAVYYQLSNRIYTGELENFGPVTFGFGYNIILPLKLISFKGTIKNDASRLEWNITEPNEVLGFVLEYSNDGKTYRAIKNISSNGTSNYEFQHENLPGGKHYYKLLVKDQKGKKFYSPVVMLFSFEKNKADVDFIFVEKKSELVCSIFSARKQIIYASIFDIAGRKIKTEKYVLNAGKNHWQIAVLSLAKGVYFLKVETEDGLLETNRFIKD
ncbi:MAG: T9SS type A sorting domain-containing protein [Bacteroidota bacterium]